MKLPTNAAKKTIASNLTDEELVVLSTLNQRYFLHLIKRYEQRLSHYLLRITNFSLEDVEDILQEVFIKTYKHLNGFKLSGKFSSWIYRIARNEAIGFYRKLKCRPNVISIDNDLDIFTLLPSNTNLEKEVGQQFTSMEIKQVLNKLDQRYKEVLVLRYFEERDYKEIAYILRKPMGTVATLLKRAKKAFRHEMVSANEILKYSNAKL